VRSLMLRPCVPERPRARRSGQEGLRDHFDYAGKHYNPLSKRQPNVVAVDCGAQVCDECLKTGEPSHAHAFAYTV